MGYKGETQYQMQLMLIHIWTKPLMSIQWMDGVLVDAGSLYGSK
jgi:hypothetical protein